MIRVNVAVRQVCGIRGVSNTSSGNLTFKLPSLPYAMNALEPFISRETLEFHYGKHHQAYVDNLNKLVQQNSSLTNKSLEEIIRTAEYPSPAFNNAAQVWNHSFYWNCMKPNGGGEPHGELGEAIKRDFGSFAAFKSAFSNKAISAFGSGWAFLVKDGQGKLKIVECHDAMTPIRDGSGAPIITCDVWEHAYYIDTRNARAKYVDNWWNVVNWDFAQKNYLENKRN
jgi:Fe-Mn family superoxide dismutase